MVYRLVILPLAQRELEKALFWYEAQQRGLGLDFLTYFESYLLALQHGHIKFQVKKQPFYKRTTFKKISFCHHI